MAVIDIKTRTQLKFSKTLRSNYLLRKNNITELPTIKGEFRTNYWYATTFPVL